MLASSTIASSSRSILTGTTALSRSAFLLSPRRLFNSTRTVRQEDDGNPFARPAPPSLPPKEQREFEQLVKEKANSMQFKISPQGEEMHPQYLGKPKPDFEGEINPKTGEVGGPKKEPLTWERE